MCVSTEANREEATTPSITAQARNTNYERGHARNAPVGPPGITNFTPGASERSSVVMDSSNSEQFGQSSRDRSSSAADTQFVALARNEGRGSIIEHHAEGAYGDENQQSVRDAAPNGIEVDNVRASDMIISPLPVLISDVIFRTMTLLWEATRARQKHLIDLDAGLELTLIAGKVLQGRSTAQYITIVKNTEGHTMVGNNLKLPHSLRS